MDIEATANRIQELEDYDKSFRRLGRIRMILGGSFYA